MPPRQVLALASSAYSIWITFDVYDVLKVETYVCHWISGKRKALSDLEHC